MSGGILRSVVLQGCKIKFIKKKIMLLAWPLDKEEYYFSRYYIYKLQRFLSYSSLLLGLSCLFSTPTVHPFHTHTFGKTFLQKLNCIFFSISYVNSLGTLEYTSFVSLINAYLIPPTSTLAYHQ